MRAISKFLIFMLLFFIGCKPKKDVELNWSNSRLLEIPSKVRHLQYLRGNLVPNHSFEDRKIIKLDSIHYTYNVSNWKKEGSNVVFIDMENDSLFSSKEVINGKCAYKIEKSTSDEFDERGDGIVSDFIKVIPGMYSLFLNLNCKNIKPYQKRFNAKIGDAIDIRVKYFDKNKLPLSNAAYHPKLQTTIDNSFKGVSFSNFDNIDSTGWINVKCVSGYYPFNESVIPDDAKFIKISIILKGTGTLWVDNIRYFYSKENLTPRERSTIYFDSLVSPLDLLIPYPKEIEFIDTINYFNPDSGLYLEPFILVPNNDEKQFLESINILQNKLLKIFGNSKYKFDIRQIKYGTSLPEKYLGNALIISLGETYLYKEFENKIRFKPPANKSGYVINTIKGENNIVFINANEEKSIVFGAQIAEQLFIDFKLMGCNISDYPDHDLRAVVIDEKDIDSVLLKKMFDYRINALFKKDPVPGKYPVESYPVISYEDNGNIPQRHGKALLFIPENATDFNPENILKTCMSHKARIDRTAKIIDDLYLSGPISSCESLMNKPLLSKIYFTNIDLPKNVILTTNGSHHYSQYFDGILKYYYSSVSKAHPTYINNFQEAKTPSVKMNDYFKYYPEKIPMGNIFDPYDNYGISQSDGDVMLKLNASGILSLFRISTFGEYAWNSQNYDPDLSLFKVIVKEYGKDAAKYFYYYNDAYCGLLTTITKVGNDGPDGKTSKSAEKEIVMLNISFEEIKERLPDETEILDMLFVSKRLLIDKYNAVYEKAIIDKKIKEDSSLSSIFTPAK